MWEEEGWASELAIPGETLSSSLVACHPEDGRAKRAGDGLLPGLHEHKALAVCPSTVRLFLTLVCSASESCFLSPVHKSDLTRRLGATNAAAMLVAPQLCVARSMDSTF